MIPSGFRLWNTRPLLTPQPHISSEPPLVCRPSKSLWALVLIFALCGIGLVALALFQRVEQPPRRPDDFWGLIAFVVVILGLPSLALAWYLTRCRVVADDLGLTFHHFFSTQFVTWDAVEDYELRAKANQGNAEYPSGYVFVNGKWLSLGANSPQVEFYEALLERVEAQAKWSRAKKWQLKEGRKDGEWPQIFGYKDTSGWKVFGIGALILTPLNLLTVSTIISGGAARGRSLSLYDFAFPVFIQGIYYVPILAVWYLRALTIRQYLGQKIITTGEGISLQKDGVETFLPWGEVDSYYFQVIPGVLKPALAVVESRGRRIEFVSGIQRADVLLRIIQANAHHATTDKWAYPHGSSEIIGGAASLWESGQVGVGPKVYHYRTRGLRVMLWGGCIIVVVLIALLVSVALGMLGEELSIGPMLLMIPCSAVGGLWGFLEYHLTKVRVSDEGLTAESWRGKKFLKWQDIQEIRKGESGYIVKGQSGSLLIWSGMADIEGLKDEIEQHCGLKWSHHARKH